MQNRITQAATHQPVTFAHIRPQLQRDAPIDLDADLIAARRAELQAKADVDEAGLRAEAAEQRLEQLTAPKPGGHIIARNISQAELDALADECRKVVHFQFMPDGTLNAVIEPCVPHVQPSRPRNQSMVTPSGLPIPSIRRPSIPVPAHNTPRRPAPVGYPRALIVAPSMEETLPPRVPTFQEILAARLYGQITAEQFTRYSNALAGHNAAQRTKISDKNSPQRIIALGAVFISALMH